MKTFTREEIIDTLRAQFPEEPYVVEDSLELIDRWLERGDACAIYRNEEIGNPDMGHLKFVSYGGPDAQIPVSPSSNPPKRLPDIGSDINWRYVLVGTYGEMRRRF